MVSGTCKAHLTNVLLKVINTRFNGTGAIINTGGPMEMRESYMDYPGDVTIHYLSDEVKKLYEDRGGVKTRGSIGFDLLVVEDVKLNRDEFKYIPFGIVMKPPKGYYIQIVPRSSTFGKYGLVQPNSVGIIDVDYCGPGDELKWLAYCLNPKVNPENSSPVSLKKGTPIAQAILVKAFEFFAVEGDLSGNESRGGFGSTDGSEKEKEDKDE